MSAFEAIKQIIEERSRDGILPLSAPLLQTMSLTGLPVTEFKKQIKELLSMGVITMYRSINSYNFVLT